MSATATLRWDAEWVADRSGLAHSQSRRGRGRAACGAHLAAAYAASTPTWVQRQAAGLTRAKELSR